VVLGLARFGEAWCGKARRGEASFGMARHGAVRRGGVGQGTVGLGEAEQGKARFFFMSDDKKVRPLGELDRMAQFEDQLTGKPPILRRKTWVSPHIQAMVEEYVDGSTSIYLCEDRSGSVIELRPKIFRELVKFVDEVLTSAPPVPKGKRR
jgi:hypothetical protein